MNGYTHHFFIVNNDYAEIHLTKEAQETYKDKNQDNMLPWAPTKPVLNYNFGSLENFENLINDNKGLNERRHNDTIDLPEAPPILGYRAIDAFPGLGFVAPIAMATPWEKQIVCLWLSAAAWFR